MAPSIPLAVAMGTLLAAAGHAQDQQKWRTTEDPLHRVLEVVLSEDDPILEAHGPYRAVEYVVNFSGTLYVWAQSDELDPFLRVEVDGAFDSEDDDSGGGRTACIGLEVEPEQWLSVTVAAAAGATGAVELHVVAAPETKETLEAARWARERLEEVERHSASGNPEAARELLGRFLEELRGMPQETMSPMVARPLRSLCIIARRLGLLLEASELGEIVLPVYARTLPNYHPRLSVLQFDLASIWYNLRDFKRAHELYQFVLDAFEHICGPGETRLVRARLHLAMTKLALDKYEGVRSLLDSVLGAHEHCPPEDDLSLLVSCVHYAMREARFGDTHGSCRFLEDVLENCEFALPEDHPAMLSAWRNLAQAKLLLGDFEGARDILDSVLKVYARTLPADDPKLLETRGMLAVADGQLGHIERAREVLEDVLAAYRRNPQGNWSQLQVIRGNLAWTRFMLGDIEGAREIFESVLKEYELTLPADNLDVLHARMNLATAEAQLGNGEVAHAILEDAFWAYRRILPEHSPELLHAQLNFAASKLGIADNEGAHALLMDIVTRFESTLPEDHPYLLQVRYSLAATKRLMGDRTGAIGLLEDVLAAYKRSLPAGHYYVLLARANLALTKFELGDVEGAGRLLAAQIDGLSRSTLDALVLPPREAIAASTSENLPLSLVLFLCESLRRNPVMLRQLMGLIETRRHVASASLTMALRGSRHPEVDALRRECHRLGRALGERVSLGPAAGKSTDEWRQGIVSIALERDRLQYDLFQRIRGRGPFIGAIDPAVLARRLAPDAVAVGFLRYDPLAVDEDTGVAEIWPDKVLAMILRPDGSVQRVALGTVEDLARAIRAWRRAIGKPVKRVGLTEEEVAAVGERHAGLALRRVLLDPVLKAAHLPEEGGTLYVCLDDCLHMVPLDALPLEEGFVGDRYRIRQEVSFARLISPPPRSAPGSGLLAVGDVDFQADPVVDPARPTLASAPMDLAPRNGIWGEWDRLPWTRVEVEVLDALHEETFGARALILTRERATKAAIEEAVRGRRYVHLATHGWFMPETVRSLADAASEQPLALRLEDTVRGFAPLSLCGLCLTGANRGRDEQGSQPGLMTAEELAWLDLTECDLAVLSACETNVGVHRAGLGIQSLKTALHAAGARTVVTSLWKVGDKETMELMTAFYTKLWKKGMGKAEALWQAKRGLRERHYPVSAWAGWVLTGEP